MRRLLLYIAMAILSCNLAMGQKITKHEVDRFTKATVIETSAIKMYNKFGMMRPYMFKCFIRKYNDSYVMPTILMFDGMNVYKFTEDNGAYFLLDNGESIFLQTTYTGLTDKGEFSTVFNLSPENVALLRTNKVVAIRITYLGGSYEHDVDEKNQDKIIEMLKLVDSAK
jgi:hypothetical protein